MTLTQQRDQAVDRLLDATRDAIHQLTQPRIIHTDITNDHGGITAIHTEEHPPLLDLLTNADTLQRGSGRGSSPNSRIPIDAEAHELRNTIRTQLNEWMRRLKIAPTRDLKADLDRWHLHHETAVLRNQLDPDRATATLRTLEAWTYRIDAKFDPGPRLEFTDPCPNVTRTNNGEPKRCGARKVRDDHGDLTPAIEINIDRKEARCRSCGRHWEGERGLRELRYEADQAAAIATSPLTDTPPAE